MGAQDTGDGSTLSQAITSSQYHIVTSDIIVVSSQTLASSIRQFNCLYCIHTLPLHCQYNLFHFVMGKG